MITKILFKTFIHFIGTSEKLRVTLVRVIHIKISFSSIAILGSYLLYYSDLNLLLC